jgi:hypothetical protein
MENLVVSRKTRRRRRTQHAATSRGALREASQPCEGRLRDGDVPVEQPMCSRNPWRGLDGLVCPNHRLSASIPKDLKVLEGSGEVVGRSRQQQEAV